MTTPITIDALSIENVKRVEAVQVECADGKSIIIGGRNGEGKTSILDGICWGLGGDRCKPTDAVRDGEQAFIDITLSNGIRAVRSGKNASLKVTDPGGSRSGQKLLDEFIDMLALRLPRFMEASEKEKIRTFLKIAGVEEELSKLDKEYDELYQERLALGRIGKQKAGAAKELPFHEDAGCVELDASELGAKLQDAINARNDYENACGAKARAAEALKTAKIAHDLHNSNGRDSLAERINLTETMAKEAIAEIKARLEDELAIVNSRAERDIKAMQDEHAATGKTLTQGCLKAEQAAGEADKALTDLTPPEDGVIDQFSGELKTISDTNLKARVNMAKDAAEREAAELRREYASMSKTLEDLDERRVALLAGADLPLAGLGIRDKQLTFNDRKWDCMSGAEQLRVATAIVRKLNPKCGFVLMDKLEQMDQETLREFVEWLDSEGMQLIATRVSTGDECTIIIEEGKIK